MKLIYKIIVFILAFALLGYFRDYIFLNVNQALKEVYYNLPKSYLQTGMTFLRKFNYSTLYYLKYPLTLLFIIFYFSLTLCLIKSFSNSDNKIIFYSLTILYIVVFFLSFFISFMGTNGYAYARFLAGVLQSPVPAMIFSSMLIFKNNKKLYSAGKYD